MTSQWKQEIREISIQNWCFGYFSTINWNGYRSANEKKPKDKFMLLLDGSFSSRTRIFYFVRNLPLGLRLQGPWIFYAPLTDWTVLNRRHARKRATRLQTTKINIDWVGRIRALLSRWLLSYLFTLIDVYFSCLYTYLAFSLRSNLYEIIE